MPGFRGGLKTAPSAGATYPLEIYLVAGEVTDLPDGIYRYIPEDHALVKVGDGDKRSELCRAAHGQDMVREAPASIVYSAIYERTASRYGSRGRDRYVCMDLGHSAQNVYLQAFALGIGTCAVGAFSDEAVKKVMPFAKNEIPLYIMPLGKI
jgi:SagB-type dehydrogenase family enzyme